MARAAPALPLGLDPGTRRLILLLPVAFLAHDLGELAGNDELNRAAEDLTRRFPVLAERILPRFTTSRAQATVAIGTLAAGVTGLSWRAARSAPRSPTMTAYAAATLLPGAHMLPHTMQAIALRRMLPGLAGGLTCPARRYQLPAAAGRADPSAAGHDHDRHHPHPGDAAAAGPAAQRPRRGRPGLGQPNACRRRAGLLHRHRPADLRGCQPRPGWRAAAARHGRDPSPSLHREAAAAGRAGLAHQPAGGPRHRLAQRPDRRLARPNRAGPGTAHAVVVLSNSVSSIDDIGVHLLDERVELAAAEERPELTLAAQVLERYVGVYQLAPDGTVTLTQTERGRVAEATGLGIAPIYAASETEFFVKVINVQLTFQLDPTEAVTGLVLHHGGKHIPGKKIR